VSKPAPKLVQPMFDPLVGTEFRIATGGLQAVPVELVGSTALTPAATRDDLPIRTDPFSLVFKGSHDLDLEQRIYELEHEDLGSLELFLVPVGFGEYEAVIN